MTELIYNKSKRNLYGVLYFIIVLHLFSCENYRNEKVIFNDAKTVRTAIKFSKDNIYNSIKDDFRNDTAARLYVVATRCLLSNEIDSALVYMRKAYQIERKNKLLLKDFGGIFMNANKIDSAKIYLHKAIMLDSTYSMAIISYGLCFYNEDNDRLAIEYYNKAIKYDPDNEAAHLNKALAFQQLGLMDSCCIYLNISSKYTNWDSEKYYSDLKQEFGCEK